MSKIISIFLLVTIGSAAFGQKAPPVKKPTGQTQKQPVSKSASVKRTSNQPAPEPTPDPEADRKQFDAAIAGSTNQDKARLLRRFIDHFPNSELRPEAYDYLVTSRALVGNEQLKNGEIAEGVASLKMAIDEAPVPTPDRLFEDVIAKIPASLFYGGHRGPAIELAAEIEKKYNGNARRLLSLAGFFLNIENGNEAKRLAEAAITLEPASAQAFQALGLAHRLNFDLEESAKAYSKAIELDPTSAPAKRSLAEMKRATGKPEEAAAIYAELVAAKPNDIIAENGLVLSLFDSGKRVEAETILAESLAKFPQNFTLLAGVGYWYAAHDFGEKALEYGQRAVDTEPRYIWGHIALARGLMKLKRPIDAERILIKARQYGNFPTLEYEIASARFNAGLYREAVEELQKSFVLRDGMIETRLGGRLSKAEKTFGELLAYERRASILEPAAADDPDISAKLRILFEWTSKLNPTADEREIIALTQEFVKGDDKMKLHRQLHAAEVLLQKNVAVSLAADLVKAAVGNTEAGLEVSAPGAAVMASELYESRTVAFARNEIVLIPEVPRQMLSSILRGRIEELAGWSLYQQKNYPAAIVRLRRAISVMPDKSAWWRSSMWRLGVALEADGKDKEALDSYIQSYKTDRPSAIRYGVIEGLYQKVNGSTEGLEDKIGPNPLPTIAATQPAANSPEKALQVPTELGSGSVEKTPKQSAQQPVADKANVKVLETASKDQPNATDPPPARILEPPTQKRAETQREVTPEDRSMASNVPPQPADDPIAVPSVKIPASNGEYLKGNTSGADPNVASKHTDPNPSVMTPPKPNTDGEKVPGQILQTPITSTKPTDPKIDDSKETKTPADIKTFERPESPKPEIKNVGLQHVPSTSEIEKRDAGSNGTLPNDKPTTLEPTNLLRDPLPEPPSGTIAAETERKPLVIIKDPVKSGLEPKTRELFDPVIISVQRDPTQKATAVKETPVGGNALEKTVPDATGATRRRVIEGKDIQSDQKCSIEVSQENISLLNGGGSLGVLVTIAGDGDTRDVTATSNSPRDIEVKAEVEIDGIADRRFYVVKSVSPKVGNYLVNFESPCGKREISVRVR